MPLRIITFAVSMVFLYLIYRLFIKKWKQYSDEEKIEEKIEAGEAVRKQAEKIDSYDPKSVKKAQKKVNDFLK